MAYGVYRRNPVYHKSPRRRIYTMPRSATVIILPDPSVLDVVGRRKHFYFQDYDNSKMVLRTKQAGHFIKLDASTSSSGGQITSSTNGGTVHLIAVNDTTWKAQSYTGTWGVT